jgi:hypothetical protein
MFNKDIFINEAAKEMERVEKLKQKAWQQGKRSKANINFNKFGKKFGLNPEGYTFLDMFFSHMIMNQIGEMFSFDERAGYLELANKAFEASKDMLEKELGVAL